MTAQTLSLLSNNATTHSENTHRVRRVHNLPTISKINLIIEHASPKYKLIYKIALECGLRPVEISNLTPSDFNFERGTVSVLTAKHGVSRLLPLNSDTLALLIRHVKEKGFNEKDKIFPRAGIISNTYGRLRTQLAKQLNDSDLHQIRLYDFRHYYASQLYAKTKDILLTKERLGHRNIQNTLIYTHLVNFEGDEFTCKAASTVTEATALIESGYEYICDMDNIKLFRKRK